MLGSFCTILRDEEGDAKEPSKKALQSSPILAFSTALCLSVKGDFLIQHFLK